MDVPDHVKENMGNKVTGKKIHTQGFSMILQHDENKTIFKVAALLVFVGSMTYCHCTSAGLRVSSE